MSDTTQEIRAEEAKDLSLARHVRIWLVIAVFAVVLLDFVVRHTFRGQPFTLLEILSDLAILLCGIGLFDWKGAKILLGGFTEGLRAWKGGHSDSQT